MSVTGEQRDVAAASADGALAPDVADPPLMAPLTRELGWSQVQDRSQSAAHRADPVLLGIRATAVVRRGTRMVKVLSAAQVAGHLSGWSPAGFCYRARDIAHLRTPRDLAPLRTDGTGTTDAPVAFALRWRAVDPVDYEIPMGAVQPGLITLPAHSRVGPMVLGTGFTPSIDDLIPEFLTAGFADLPLPANSQLLAYPPDGTEVVLFTYQPEQHGWLRLAGPRWRHLLTELPGISPDQEYVPCAERGASRLVGWFGDREYEAVADPPREFRVRALTRAARYPVSALSRRAEQARWRGSAWWVLHRDGEWARLRLQAPDADSVATSGARCYERGVYELWAPTPELVQHTVVAVGYAL